MWVEAASASPRIRSAALFALVAAGYVLGYELASNWFSAEDQGASFFPAAGVTLAVLVLVERRLWPVVLAAAASAELSLDLWNGTSVLASSGYALANTAEPLVGALLLTTFVDRVDLRRTRDLTAFLGFAVLLSPVVGATIAATTWVFVDDRNGWARFAFEWWSGDGLGVLVVGGAILSLRSAPRLPWRRAIEGAVVAAVAIGVTAAVFRYGWFEFVYVPVALLVVLAFRVGTTGVAVTSALVAFVAAGTTAEAQDFWESVDISPANRVLYLQLALGVVIASLLALAAEIAERERMAVELARTESERTAALERVSLYEAEREARQRAQLLERNASHLAAAVTATDVASSTVDSLVAAGVPIVAVEALQSDSARGEYVAVLAKAGAPDLVADLPHAYPIEAETPGATAIRTGRPLDVASGADYQTLFPSTTRLQRPGRQSFFAVPIRSADGRILGAVSAAARAPGWFDEGRKGLVTAIAEQAALAFERASLLGREKEARRRAERLERQASRLAAAETPRDVARATIAGLEDIGVAAAWVQLLRGDSLEIVDSFGAPDESLQQYARYTLDLGTPPAETAREEVVVVASTGDELDSRYPAAAVGRHGLSYESLVWVPLRAAGGRTIGVLTLTSREPHWLNDERRRLVVGLAEQCGLVLERVELRAEADAAASDAALLAHIGEVLERQTGVRDRARALVEALTRNRASLAVVHMLDEHARPRLLADASRERSPVAAQTVLGTIADAAVGADGPTSADTEGLHLVAAPLRARERVLGVLTLGEDADTGAPITPVLVQRIATRAALAFDNALLYEQERDVSHSLQMGLLGDKPAAVPGTAIATAYRPAMAALEVGGDWYDTVTLPGGRLALLVGDVVGHGLEAAVAMGQLRGAVRALAPIGSPSELLRRLDDFVDTLPEAGMATLAYVELDPSSGALSYACAGHPPPLIVPAEGDPRLLWDGRSPPLGSSFAGEREDGTDRLQPGDVLVLYTDGLVERRTGGISAGLEVLLDVARRRTGGAPSNLVERILDRVLEDAEQDDDVCILAVRLEAVEQRFAHSFAAAPSEVARMRRALTGWLEGVELSPDRRRDVILAASEAAANAAEHAYGFDGVGVVSVEAWVSDRELRLAVRDEGSWREPEADTDRGRGRTMMEALMRNVTIEHGAGGTVVTMSVPTSDPVLA